MSNGDRSYKEKQSKLKGTETTVGSRVVNIYKMTKKASQRSWKSKKLRKGVLMEEKSSKKMEKGPKPQEESGLGVFKKQQ